MLPRFAVDDIAGNAATATKGMVALKLIEVSILPKADEPERQEARVVLEMNVTDEMLNLGEKMHGACIMHLVDICSTLPIIAMSHAQGGSGSPGVSQTINTLYHAPASLYGRQAQVSCDEHHYRGTHYERTNRRKTDLNLLRDTELMGPNAFRYGMPPTIGSSHPQPRCVPHGDVLPIAPISTVNRQDSLHMSLDAEGIQKCLLLGRWDARRSPDSPSVVKLAQAVVAGDFRTALTSSYAQELFKVHSQASIGLQYGDLLPCSLQSVTDEQERELIQLTLAVACLHAFLQANWTGPDLDIKPSDIISFPPDQPSVTDQALNTKAIAELAYGGEPAYHLAQFACFLRFAQIILGRPYIHCRYAPWWRFRVAVIHEYILDEPAPLPSELLESLEPLVGSASTDPDLSGRLLLEKGLLEHTFSHDKAAVELFVRAARATGLQYELTGALGRRTKFQQTDLSQLVLLAESRKRDRPADENDHIDQSFSIDDGGGREVQLPETLLLNDDTLLEQTEFTSTSAVAAGGSALSHLDPSSQPPLHPLDQCILLSLCLNVRNTSPSHGLTAEQMSPYVARVISHPQNWSVHTMALLLRSRLEASRTRTVERSTLQLQALVDQMPTADSKVSERLLYIHSMPLPSKWEMERELALRFLSLGVVKSALEIFQRLEMWEEVVKCWQSMERSDKAIAIVRDLLEGRKEEADSVIAKGKDLTTNRRASMDTARESKLWCLLGDLEPDNAVQHYEHAWKLSEETSGRAMRSLGGYYFSRGEFAKAATCLQRAVAINPLIARTWFVLGCAFIRLENWEGARDAFSRCVAIDDEDAESWNNLATIYLRLDEASKVQDEEERRDEGQSGKAISFSNKMMAFRALKQGLKYSYDNWRMWSNYMVVAVDVGELFEACRAQARIVEERADKVGAESVDEQVIERLVDAATRVQGDSPPDHATTIQDQGIATDAIVNSNESRGLVRRVIELFERTILPRVSAPRIFRAYARLLTSQSRWEDALNAHLNAYRSGPAGTFEKGETDIEKWREAVSEVGEMVDILVNFGPRVEGFDWKHQGRSILRTFMGRSRDFEDEPEWLRLSEMLDWLQSEEQERRK
ncbi:hypothetical protein ID866_4755 [Astraeus odoratus]|nr:hypothetical protein ID866_4755 [Astraeus odoratus]